MSKRPIAAALLLLLAIAACGGDEGARLAEESTTVEMPTADSRGYAGDGVSGVSAPAVADELPVAPTEVQVTAADTAIA